jgi:hypothetical protein
LKFVGNVMKFQGGEEIIDCGITDDDDDGAVSKKKQKEAQQQAAAAAERERERIEKQRKEEELKLKKQKEIEEQMRNIERMKLEQQKQLDRIQREREEKKLSASSQTAKVTNRSSSTTTKQAIGSKQLSMSTSTKKSKNKKKQNLKVTPTEEQKDVQKEKPPMPKQGKAKIKCGCFGTVHKPLANCLHCGRIICEKEGYGYCPFCFNRIDETMIPQGEAFEKAIMHKERLLQFDRECSSRTVVYDSQADYYSNSKSNWLTKEEQLKAEQKEDDRNKELHGRKHKLDLSI